MGVPAGLARREARLALLFPVKSASPSRDGDTVPKKLRLTGPLEPALIFRELFKEFLKADKEFLVKTDDPAVPSFAEKLIEEHYPPQSQLPLD